MPFAITLRLDPISAAFIEEMWRVLAEQGIDADRQQLGYPPHITLAIYPDTAPVSLLHEGVTRMAEQWDALPVTLSGIGVFPGPTSTVWIAPIATAELLARQSALRMSLPSIEIHAHYRQARWMPHITLSGALADPERAIAVLAPRWRAIEGCLDRLDLLHFRPVQVLQSCSLLPQP